jgi:hypothetical protein
MSDFKAAPYEGVLNPGGLWVVLRQDIGSTDWIVKVYDFANWKHREFRFPDEASARRYFVSWLI